MKAFSFSTSRLVPVLLFLLSSATASPAYDNCRFKVSAYAHICAMAVKRGVSIDYANRYLLSPQTNARDTQSLRLFNPTMIPQHHANEKKANNALLSFVPSIKAHLDDYKAVYDLAEKRYGVNREIIAAILAKETRLGTIGSTHDAFTVFNTLVRELPFQGSRNQRLIRMAQNNIVSLMQFCYRHGTAPSQCRFKSSYAGAVGIPQFMPQNFGLIESYGNGPGSLERMEDAILSTARYLHERAGFTHLLEWQKVPNMSRVENAWYAYDFQHDNASFAFEKSAKSNRRYNCYACAKPELAYLSEYIKKIMRYNNASNYAVGVLRLAWDARSKQSP